MLVIKLSEVLQQLCQLTVRRRTVVMMKLCCQTDEKITLDKENTTADKTTSATHSHLVILQFMI